MKNKEKYQDEIRKRVCGVNTPWRNYICNDKECSGCAGRFIEWSEQEALPDITGLEEEILKRIDFVFKFIARDQDGKLFVYCQKPSKLNVTWMPTGECKLLPLPSLFDWITFDDVEPWCIDDLVKRPGGGYNTNPHDLVRPSEKDIDVYAK